MLPASVVFHVYELLLEKSCNFVHCFVVVSYTINLYVYAPTLFFKVVLIFTVSPLLTVEALAVAVTLSFCSSSVNVTLYTSGTNVLSLSK